jgi:hypothetical protein
MAEHLPRAPRKRGTCTVCGRPGLALLRGGLVWPHCPMIGRGRRGQYGEIVYLDSHKWCAGGEKPCKEGTYT